MKLNKNKLVQISAITGAVVLEKPFYWWLNIHDFINAESAGKQILIGVMTIFGLLHIISFLLNRLLMVSKSDWSIQSESDDGCPPKSASDYNHKQMLIYRIILLASAIIMKYPVDKWTGILGAFESISLIRLIVYELITFFGLVYLIGTFLYVAIKLCFPTYFKTMKAVVNKPVN